MELPRGLHIKNELGKECVVQDAHISDSHILGWAKQKNTDMKFIGYSLSNMVFDKGTENLMSIEFVADKNMKSSVYPIILKNIVLATKTQTIKLCNQIIYVSIDNMTGIDSINNNSTINNMFNVQGVKLQNPQRGINIINRKKVLIK